MPRSTKQKSIYSGEYKELAKRLRKARERAGLTQVQAAKKLGRPQSYISKVESAQYYLDIFELKRMVRLYAASLSEFI